MLIAGHTVRLNTSWVNYNCAVRMVGRLRMEYREKEGSPWLPELPYSLRPSVTAELEKGAKVALIKELINGIEDKSLVPPLHGDEGQKNPIFLNDGGKYVPTVIMCADDLLTTKGPFWNRWAALIRELQANYETYGVEVIAGPLFNNAVYAPSAHISRIWSLVLPKYKNNLLNAGNVKWTKADLAGFGYSKDSLSTEDWSDIQKLLKAA